MPKGAFSLTVEEKSAFHKEAESSTPEHMVLSEIEGLVLRISKQVSLDGERLIYRLSEHELSKKQVIDFDSCFFDDSIKIQVYQKNSTAKVNQVGKVSLPLAELVFENLDDADEEFYPVTLRDKRTGFEAGTLLLKVNYKPIESKLLSPDWPRQLKTGAISNKFEFFNDNLANEFKDDC